MENSTNILIGNVTANSTGLFIDPDNRVNPVNAIVMPTFGIIAILTCYLPMRDFWRKGNLAASSIIVAVTLLNLYVVINAFIWNDDNTQTWYSGKGICDIEVNSRYMLTTAGLTCMACFIKNLAAVFNPDNPPFITAGMKRRRLIIDILICWLLPFIQVVVHYTITIGRFAVFPIYGCYDGLDESWPYILVFWVWGPIFVLMSTYYSVRLLIGLVTHRKIISCTLASSGSGMSSKYFIKLSIIGLTSILIWGPIQMFYAYLNWPRPLHPYNFAVIHQPEKWNQIIFLPTALNGQLQYNGWAGIAMSFMIYAYFGFNHEALDTYRGWLVKCGCGKIWPSLKEPRVPVQRSRHGSEDSRRASLSEKLDLVGKAMRFFDGGRKDGLATGTTGVGSTIGAPSTASSAAMMTGATSFSESGRKGSQATTSTGMTTGPDAITPLPQIPEITSPHLYPAPIQPSPSAKMPFFSIFRTHLNLPFPIFSSSPQKSARVVDISPSRARTTCSRHQNTDLEAQNSRPITTPSGYPNSDLVHHEKNHPVLRTNIWSETDQLFEAISKGNEKADREKEKGKFKMGTKAYRDSEKIELEQQKNKDAETANAVIVEHALERKESQVDMKSG